MSDTIATNETEAELVPLSTSRQRLKTWARVLSHFLAGQACLQAVNAVTGLMLLRWLSVTAYAQYSIAFGFQSTFAVLVDLGFSGTIVALVGDRVDDKLVVGRYIRSAQHFRSRLFIVASVAALIFYPLLTYKHHWSLTANVVLLGTIISSILFQGWSMYSSPLLMHRRMKQIYIPQVYSGVLRAILCFVLYVAGHLSAWTTALFNTAAVALSGWLIRRNAKPFVSELIHSDPATNREMLRYLSPGIPSLIFNAFQGQLTLALVAIFGHTVNIAEVAALGRLSQLFIVLSSFNGTIVEPYIARVSTAQLPHRYTQIAFASIALAIALYGMGLLFPGKILLLLGTKYQHLQHEVPLVILASCILYVAQVLWTMHSARRWVFWWATAVYISLMVGVQIICVLRLNLGTTDGVIHLSLAMSGAILLSQIFIGCYGFSIQSRTKHNKITI